MIFIVLLGGAVVAVVVVVLWVRATSRKPAAVDPIASTTGSNRALTGGVRPTGGATTLTRNEALRRLVAYALDDAPREALSKPPDPAHAPVFKAVQQILEKIDAQPQYIPRRPSLLPKLLATVISILE